ncbi:hydroxymethylbilane synthase [Streptomyces sp. RY43-2]|uniref:Hydroxymethylbilane synthase n=1 Tax=Streptomyces macrolidinus TaxID=2952607 RepID=A0ABT0ZLQ1_9ACTN|nr:hydroxymethylbilane synthase [Streptomyces macrolidinus]MCN9244506.1 hydroxymethylbilane synthase [Streptomyces macrolidinus]
MTPLRIGARASLMSLSQSAPILTRLAPTPTLLQPFYAAGGDREQDRAPLEEDGVFSQEIEAALLSGDIDVAVHCLKDVPTRDTPGLNMAAYLRRDDIRDCLVTCDPDLRLDTLPPGATVGTASLRRTASLRAYRPDLEVVPLRGPVSDRLQALSQHDVDALIVASCSMERLGLRHRINERISPEIICPPLGAAIIALQTREDDMETRRLISKLHHPETEVEAEAERLVLRRMGGFCNAPLAGYCTTTDDGNAVSYTVRTRVFSPDGGVAINVRLTGADAMRTAAAACQRLTQHGALGLAKAE